jgi:hypothetical protein
VRHDPSGWCRRRASPQVGSSLRSAWLHPGWHSDNEGIAKEIATTSVLNEASDVRNALYSSRTSRYYAPADGVLPVHSPWCG